MPDFNPMLLTDRQIDILLAHLNHYDGEWVVGGKRVTLAERESLISQLENFRKEPA